MSLNPLQSMLKESGLRAFEAGSAFKPVADASLNDFQAVRSDLERKVKHGELTLKVAKEQAGAASNRLREDLLRKSAGHADSPRIFLDRLVETANQRRKARESMSLESLQRETNRMLRQLVVEGQVGSRAGEFEAKTFRRPVAGGDAAPSLDSLLAFHEQATLGGDEAAREWTRRQLEAFRVKILNPDDQRRIDLACDRPEVVNPRIAARYLEAMKPETPDNLERFVTESIESKDANACAAAFLLARSSEEGTRARWVRLVLNSLGEFPDAAIQSLRAYEAEVKSEEIAAARQQADFVIGRIETEAKMTNIQAPGEAELERLARVESLPMAQPGEAIGLTL